MISKSSLTLANQHIADLHREAEADRRGAKASSVANPARAWIESLRRIVGPLSRQVRSAW
jgi:hypothetical protein